jgi:hypothetical protein
MGAGLVSKSNKRLPASGLNGRTLAIVVEKRSLRFGVNLREDSGL